MSSTDTADAASDRYFTPRLPVHARVQGQHAVDTLSWTFDVVPYSLESFAVTLDMVVFDTMTVVRSRQAPARVERTDRHVAALALGLSVYLVTAGSLIASQGGRTIAVQAGQGVVLSGYESYCLDVAEPIDMVSVVLRRRTLDRRSTLSAERPMALIPASPYQHAVTAFLRAASPDLPRPTSPEGQSLQQATLSMITGLLGVLRDAAPEVDRGEGWLSQARTFIELNYADPTLSTADVSAAVRISSRHLQRVLAERHTSVADELRHQRMTWAKILLLEHRDLPVEEVAERTGFGTVARMRRAFVHELGITPARFRASAPHEVPMELARR